MLAETKPAPTLLPYPTLQKQLNPLTGRSTLCSQATLRFYLVALRDKIREEPGNEARGEV